MVPAAYAVNSRRRPAKYEARLAHAAAGGDSRAVVTLLSRYERRAFELAYRITDSTDDAANVTQHAFLESIRGPRPAGREFGSTLFTNICNAGCDLPEKNGSAEPLSAPGAPIDDRQDEIREANSLLPPRERAVLALRELEGMSYHEIAEVMHTDRDSVGRLISSARLGLRDAMRGTLPASNGDSIECERSPLLIAMRDDAQLDDQEETDWLLEHLAHCADCRLRLDAMQEAGSSYRAFGSVTPPPDLFERTTAGAAGLGRGDENRAAARTDVLRHHPRRNPLVTCGLVLLALLGVSGVAMAGTLLLGGGSDAPEPGEPPVALGSAPTISPAVPPKEVKRERKAARAPAVVPAPRAVQGYVLLTPPAARRRPDATPRRGRRPSRKRPAPRTPPAPTVPDPRPAPPAPTAAPPTTPPSVSPPQAQPPACQDTNGLPVACPG